MAVRPVVLYNVQRLFRPGGSRIARALDATEERGWTQAVYRRKVAAVGAMLSSATAGARPALLILIEVEDAVVVADVCAAAGWPELVDLTVPNEAMDGYDVAIAYDPPPSALFRTSARSPSRTGSRHATCSWQRCTSTNHVH